MYTRKGNKEDFTTYSFQENAHFQLIFQKAHAYKALDMQLKEMIQTDNSLIYLSISHWSELFANGSSQTSHLAC